MKIIKLGKKEFKIVKWENKSIGDFKYPKGWVLAEHSEFIKLFDKGLIDTPTCWNVFWTKHFSKIKQKEGLLSRSCLNWYLYLGSDNDNLAVSDSNGRVVLRKGKLK